MPKLKPADSVEWETWQGKIPGRVMREIKGTAKAGGHTARASADDRQYEVKSDKSGKKAIHRPDALRKLR